MCVSQISMRMYLWLCVCECECVRACVNVSVSVCVRACFLCKSENEFESLIRMCMYQQLWAYYVCEYVDITQKNIMLAKL